MNVLITVPLGDELMAELREAFPAIQFRINTKFDEASDEDLQAEIVVSYNSQLKLEVFPRLTDVKWIHVFSAGVDNLPLQQLEQNRIVVTNSSGAHQVPMSEFAIGIMLNESKRFIPFHEAQKKGEWMKKVKLEELDRKTVAILGTGSIGQEIAKRAKVFGMNTLGVNRSGRQVEGFDHIFTQDQVKDALSRADYVIVVAPLTSSTRNWLTADKLRCMKQDAVFINLGRGELVDENALIQVLQERLIRKAYLDVFQVEPLPADSPIWTLDNCVIYPHISAISDQYNKRCCEIFVHNLHQYIQGGALDNVVEAEHGY